MSVAIALDGPAGAGKSTIAKRAAKALDYIYIDTGALYRTIGLSAMRRNIEPVESKEVSDMLSEIKVEIAFNDKMEQIVLLDGEDVSSLIRTPEVSMTASKISAIPEVRAYLLDLQRNMAKKNNVIMDGRDIGSSRCKSKNLSYRISRGKSRKTIQRTFGKGNDCKLQRCSQRCKRA